MIAVARRYLMLVSLALTSLSMAWAAELAPEKEPLVLELQGDLERIRQDVVHAQQEYARYTGGVIRTLIGIRLEVLRTNAALVNQRIHTIKGGVRPTIVVNGTKPNPNRAAQLAKEIEVQKQKVAEAQREANRYSGGLVQTLSEMNVVTVRNTLAMLEQGYLIAKYGLALPTPISRGAGQLTAPAEASAAQERAVEKQPTTTGASPEQKDCLKIDNFDSSILSTNEVFTELAWKVDVSNSCAKSVIVQVTFAIYDKDEFELESDNETVYVPAHGVGKARARMLVSPPEKARRMAKQGVSVSAF